MWFRLVYLFLMCAIYLWCMYHGTVRLIDGLIPEEGTVEVCVNAVWSSVCPSYWDYKDAFVVCRQLGYPATGENYNGGPCTVRGEISVSVCWRVVRVSYFNVLVCE